MAGIVTLTTDFGMRDPYVAAMKGVILSICPHVHLHDLSHDISPHDVWEASFFLCSVLPYYPQGATHVVVVDPQVGSQRKALVAKVLGQFIVCPDNGILTFALRRYSVEQAYFIENPHYMLPHVSKTFHGRDIFAPAAAHIISCGGIPTNIGSPTSDYVCLEIPQPHFVKPAHIIGEVIHVDRFGNVISNISPKDIGNDRIREVRCGDVPVSTFVETYSDVTPGEMLSLWNSAGFLEIAANCDNAAQRLNVKRGTVVEVLLSEGI